MPEKFDPVADSIMNKIIWGNKNGEYDPDYDEPTESELREDLEYGTI